jgi:hypothetical protein
MPESMDVPNPLNGLDGGTPALKAPTSLKQEPWEELASKLDEPTTGIGHCCHKQIVKWSYFWLVVKESPIIHKAFVITVSLQSVWIVASVRSRQSNWRCNRRERGIRLSDPEADFHALHVGISA